MTEEEAIDVLKSPLLKEDGYERHQAAIDTILDLYYKQKEDIMYFRTDIQDLADDLELWQDRCGNSVDKDDIRHKIMELEDKERLLLMSPLEKQYKVQVLKELLKE